MNPARHIILSYAGLLILFGLTAERITCIRHAAQVQFAADAAAQAARYELARGASDIAVVSAVQRKTEMDGFGPASGARVSAAVSPDRKSVAVTITKADLPCLFERVGLATDRRTATSVLSTERPPERSGTSHSICFNLFPC